MLRRHFRRLRSQPDHVKARAALTYTVAAGTALVILWLVALLPAQLYLLRHRGGEAEVAGTRTAPTPSALVPILPPSLFGNLARPSPLDQPDSGTALPLASPVASPSPTPTTTPSPSPPVTATPPSDTPSP